MRLDVEVDNLFLVGRMQNFTLAEGSGSYRSELTDFSNLLILFKSSPCNDERI
jgi:hypothetical protein